ncbi:hypothetical protein [Thalassococcus sp. S3]|uniref:hypothetical protein n=1 Tax=Thalassococcus sp. S3 TaxID=2017482 RepID=UPI001024613E|nr:hypothetical protein [Thalassococcus sp. S3]QBF32407.1 hypothetical protein CFI11_14460 [Thalassococcus sp. S3]
MIRPDLSIPERIKEMIQQEISEYRVQTDVQLATLDAFRAALVEPRLVTVNFSGGVTQKCWSVTRSNGDYRVVYLPIAGYFSLCVESDFGPLDIGVHGEAIGCFASV